MFSAQNAEIRLRCYKGSVSVLSRTSETEKLYSSEEASMDSLENFSVLDTSTFLTPTLHTSLDICPILDCFQFRFPNEIAFADWSSVMQLALSMSMPSGSRSTDCRRPRKGKV